MNKVEFTDVSTEIVEDTKTKEVEMDGRKFRIIKSDPYGFFSVFPVNGPVPKELQGSYTSRDEAEKGLRNYLNKLQAVAQQAPKVEVELPAQIPSPAPPIKYKKAKLDGDNPT